MNTVNFLHYQRNIFIDNVSDKACNECMDEQVKKSLNDFETFQRITDILLQDSENLHSCFTFIQLVIEELKNDFFTKASYAHWFLFYLSKPVLEKLVDKSSQLFAMLLECLVEHQSKKILKNFAKENKNWKIRFQTVFRSLERSKNSHSPIDQAAGRFIVNVINALQPFRKKQWIKFCTLHLPLDDWAFFLLALNKEHQTFALRAIMRIRSFDLTMKGLSPFMNALAKQTSYQALVNSIFNKILRYFYCQSKFLIILEQIPHLSYRSQICLLNLLPFTKLVNFVILYREEIDLLAIWIDGLFQMKPNFYYRRDLIVLFTSFFNEEQFEEFLYFLTKDKSPVGGYFLNCLPNNYKEYFILNISYVQRTELLSNSCADESSNDLLSKIKDPYLNWIYENMTINFANPSVPIEENDPLTLKTLMEETIKHFNKEDEYFISIYSPLLQSIPAILIGVLSNIPDSRDTLLNLAEYLTEEQLKFLMAPLTHIEICKAIETIFLTLNTHQYQAILNSLSVSDLLRFLKFKKKQLEENYQLFQEKYFLLQEAIDTVKGQEKISSAYFSEQLVIKNNLAALLRRPLLMDFQQISKFSKKSGDLNEFLKDAFEKLEEAKKKLMNHMHLIEGNQPLLTIQLDELEKKIENKNLLNEVDLLETLYHNFWLLVRDKTLPYLGISPHSTLGISHAGQLYLLGIKTNTDLDYLGISQNKKDQIEKSIEKLKSALDNSISKIEFEKGLELQMAQKLQRFWIDLLDIKYNEKTIKGNYEDIIKLLMCIDQFQLQTIALNLHNILRDFEYFDSEKIIEIQSIQEKLKSGNEYEGIFLLFEKFLISLRKKHPLFCLQRYLTENIELKKMWCGLHEMNCYSIEDLFNQKRITSIEDLFRLQKALTI